MPTHQSVPIAECHERSCHQATMFPNSDRSRARVHVDGVRPALSLHCGPWCHKEGVGLQLQVLNLAKDLDFLEEAAARVLLTASTEAQSLHWDGPVGLNLLQDRRLRHHMGHQMALDSSAHWHFQHALLSMPQGPTCKRRVFRSSKTPEFRANIDP